MGLLSSKKEKIILAAISEFAKDGFEKASIDAIALKAKVAKGTVFYHFKTKQELFEEIVSEGQKKFGMVIERKTKGMASEQSKIEKVIELEIDFIEKYRDLFSIYLDDTIKKVVSFEIIENILAAGIKKGEFRRDLETKTVAIAIFWLTAMTCLNTKKVKVKQIKDLVLKGITK